MEEIRSGEMVKTKSKMWSLQVVNATNCVRKQSDIMSQKVVASGVLGEGEIVVQSMFGRLKSPQIITGTL